MHWSVFGCWVGAAALELSLNLSEIEIQKLAQLGFPRHYGTVLQETQQRAVSSGLEK